MRMSSDSPGVIDCFLGSRGYVEPRRLDFKDASFYKSIFCIASVSLASFYVTMLSGQITVRDGSSTVSSNTREGKKPIKGTINFGQ